MGITEKRRIAGLDSVRFFAALWVVFNHCGTFPLTEGIDRGSPVGWALNAVYGNLFAGPAAVMVFFVISGFCIHYPYYCGGEFKLPPYLLRRYLRVGLPLIVAICISTPLHVNLRFFQNSILWTLAAELIYYTLYPMLRAVAARMEWRGLIAVAYALGLGTASLHAGAADYTPFGPGLSWLLGLPCWLLGCRLAETNFDRKVAVSVSGIWTWRAVVWGISAGCSALRFHSSIGYPWTLLVFGVPVYFWLEREITYFKTHTAIPLWEWAGTWSYAIYLTHLISNSIYQKLTWPNLGPNLNWVLRMTFVLLGAYTFFRVVERPAHRIARMASRRVQRRNAINQTVSSRPIESLGSL